MEPSRNIRICSYLRFIIHHFFLDFQLLFPYNKNALIGISNCNILLTFLCYTTLSTQGRTHHEIETADCFCDFSMFTFKIHRRISGPSSGMPSAPTIAFMRGGASAAGLMMVYSSDLYLWWSQCVGIRV